MMLAFECIGFRQAKVLTKPSPPSPAHQRIAPFPLVYQERFFEQTKLLKFLIDLGLLYMTKSML